MAYALKASLDFFKKKKRSYCVSHRVIIERIMI